MKKEVLITIITVVLLIVISVISFTIYQFHKFTTKEILTNELFTEIMTNNYLETKDATDEFKEHEEIKSVLYSNNEKDYEIYLLTFKTNEDAKIYFDNIKNRLESNKGNSYINNYFNIKSYGKYELTSNNEYYNLTKNKNTVLYLISDKQHKKEWKKIIKELNY